MMQESLTKKLAMHLMRSIDEETRQRARLHLLDWLGCVAGGRLSGLATSLRQAGTAPLKIAGFLGNLLEMDDIHRSAILHPGPVIWVAAFSDYDEANKKPPYLEGRIDAAIRGYEAMTAVGATFDAHHYAHYHPTSTAGYFGAAATAGSICELTIDQMVWALGNAGSVSGGLWHMRHDDVSTKQWHIWQAAVGGGDAARLAKCGISGPSAILEGAQGLYSATCTKAKPMQLLQNWRIHDVSFKPWGACRHAHPAIDAALELKAKFGAMDGEIIVETYADALAFCDRPNPETINDAKFSIQHAVAVAAAKGEPELTDFEPAAIAAMSGDRARVRIIECSQITARYPHHYGARVTCCGNSVELVDTLGDPERPMNEAQIIDKARNLIAWGGLADKEADRAVAVTLHGNDVRAIQEMIVEWLS